MVNEELVRSEIIETTLGLIQQFGIQKVTMQDIAKAMGKGKSTLYYYFKNKDEILDAVVEQEMDQFFQVCKTAVEKENDFRSKLKAYISAKIKILEKKLEKYKFLIENDSHYYNLSNYFKKLRFLYDEKETVLIKSILRSGTESGVINADSIAGEKEQLTAEIFLTAIRGLELEIFVQKEYKQLNEKTDLMIHILLHGLQ